MSYFFLDPTRNSLVNLQEKTRHDRAHTFCFHLGFENFDTLLSQVSEIVY